MAFRAPNFVDVFAGCGGLSLGLMQAGLVGRFAIENSPDAFATLSYNLLRRGVRPRYTWPRWLAKEPISIEDFLKFHSETLPRIAGEIDVLAGGPPCQGFSSAGRRQHDDPRNRLFKSYIKLVKQIQPKVVLVENVRGFTVNFSTPSKVENYSQALRRSLEKNYQVFDRLLDLSKFGVPQRRTRYFLLAFSPDISLPEDPFTMLLERASSFLETREICTPVTASDAISDLEISRCGTKPAKDSKYFEEIGYKEAITPFQKMMNSQADEVKDLRLARHRPKIKNRFAEIIKLMHEAGRLNVSIGKKTRSKYNLRKQALRVLDPDNPAPTITSMPDDLLHYEEARTLTVRENARLQTFPDWFEFRGKYTTGGARRRFEVPRFTQVANAVPPLVAEAFGELIMNILCSNAKLRDKASPCSTECMAESKKLAA